MTEIRTFVMREYVPAELRDEPAFVAHLADKCREMARWEGGEPVAEPSIDWHQIAEGEQVPAQDDGTVLVAVGDWRAIVTVRCEVDEPS